MQILNSHSSISTGTSVLALGSFESLSAAHMALFSRAKQQAAERGAQAGVYTFTGRPGALLFPQSDNRLIYTNEERVSILADCGMDFVCFEPFDLAFSQMEAEAFLRMLAERFHLVCAVAGFHYRFGRGAAGDAAMLQQLGEKIGFDTVIVEPVMQDGVLVSSTRIREQLLCGDVAAVARLLGRDYSITGRIAADRGVGTKMGIPTANLQLDKNRLLPKNGVYATYVMLDGVRYPSVTNIGIRPTFSLHTVTVETHILDFSGDLCGRTLTVYFLDRIRSEVKFDSREALVSQIHRDMASAKHCFAQNDR